METVTLNVQVVCPGLDAERLNELASNLAETLLAVDVDSVRPGSSGIAPAGAKSAELLAVGALVVTLVPKLMDGLITVVSSWLSRQPNDVELEIDGQRFRGSVTRSQRDDLVAAYLRHLDRPS